MGVGLAILLLGLLIGGCGGRVEALIIPFTNVRPVGQVGVLAPFEGLYRRSGYSALEAVRGALADAPPARMGIIPLALDTSLDPARAAARIVAAGNMRAVTGPLTPQEGASVAPALAALPWFAPWAVAAEGFVSAQGTHWLEALIGAAGASAQAQGAQRLLVGGMVPAWNPLLHEGLGPLPTIQYHGAMDHSAIADGAAAADLLPNDALLWLGSAADGAAAARAMRAAVPNVPIWLAPWAVDPVFFEHFATAQENSAAGAGGMAENAPEIYTILWRGPHYVAWTGAHAAVMPSAYLTYEATLYATAVATKPPGASLALQAPWRWQSVAVTSAGVQAEALP